MINLQLINIMQRNKGVINWEKKLGSLTKNSGERKAEGRKGGSGYTGRAGKGRAGKDSERG